MKVTAVCLLFYILAVVAIDASTTSPTSTDTAKPTTTRKPVTTKGKSTVAPTTAKPTTPAPTTAVHTTAAKKTTVAGTTAEQTSVKVTTTAQTTVQTTAGKTSATESTHGQTTGKHTTAEKTTSGETTAPQVTTATPPPTPPKPQINKFSVTEYNVTCILVEIGATFNFYYNDTEDKEQHKTLNLVKSSATGTCFNDPNNETQEITIPLNEIQGRMTWIFKKGVSGTNSYGVVNQSLTFNTSTKFFTKPKTKGIATMFNKTLKYNTVLGNAYNCTNQAMSYFTSSSLSGIIRVTMNTSRLTTQGFRTHDDYGNNKKDPQAFNSNVNVCAADQVTSNIVPIAVGAALAGLVIIVLIAYLIGRRRNKQGYESV